MTRTIGGVEHECLKLRVTQADLTIQIPSENVEVVGARDAVNKKGLGHILEALQATETEEPSNWSRRYKVSVKKIVTGDAMKVAKVVRDLSHRDSKKSLSVEEKRMLSKVRQILVSEPALVGKTNGGDASNRLDEVLAF